MGHNNDAETFRMVTPIGGKDISILTGLVPFGCRHPIVTSFSSAQLQRKPENNITEEQNKPKDQTISSFRRARYSSD
jgi:hypothetical protein